MTSEARRGAALLARTGYSAPAHHREGQGAERLRSELPEVPEADGTDDLRVLPGGVAHPDGVEVRAEHR